MMRISLDSPALIAVRNWLAGSQPTQRGRNGSRAASRPTFRTEQLEPRTMLDAGGMLAGLPDLVDESDTGSSAVDNRTSDRTPILSGSVQGAASQVRVRINGVRVAVVPVMDGKWTYAVPAEAALAAPPDDEWIGHRYGKWLATVGGLKRNVAHRSWQWRAGVARTDRRRGDGLSLLIEQLPIADPPPQTPDARCEEVR